MKKIKLLFPIIIVAAFIAIAVDSAYQYGLARGKKAVICEPPGVTSYYAPFTRDAVSAHKKNKIRI